MAFMIVLESNVIFNKQLHISGLIKYTPTSGTKYVVHEVIVVSKSE